MFTLDGEKHLIEMPFVTRPGASAPELSGILLAKFAAPFADSLIGHHHAAFQQQLFDIAETQAESEVQPHGVADDLCREAVVLIVVGGWWGAHAENMSHYEENAQAARQVDNAVAIITIAANSLVRQVHNRMPVILRSHDM